MMVLSMERRAETSGASPEKGKEQRQKKKKQKQEHQPTENVVVVEAVPAMSHSSSSGRCCCSSLSIGSRPAKVQGRPSLSNRCHPGQSPRGCAIGRTRDHPASSEHPVVHSGGSTGQPGALRGWRCFAPLEKPSRPARVAAGPCLAVSQLEVHKESVRGHSIQR